MKKLLLLLVLLASCAMYSQEFETEFPEKVHWTIKGKVLYGDYANGEKSEFRLIVSEYIEPRTKNKIWFINYPDYNLIYTVRMVNGELVIIASRKV